MFSYYIFTYQQILNKTRQRLQRTVSRFLSLFTFYRSDNGKKVPELEPTAPPPVAEPEMSTTATAEPDMWQVLGLQRAPARSFTAETTQDELIQSSVPGNLDLETRSTSPAESDNSFTRITIKMEVDDSKQKPTHESPEKDENLDSEPEEEEEEERPPTAMSILSNDSDDDPTW